MMVRKFLIRSPRDVERIRYFEGRKCMMKFIHFSKEVSVMVARNTRGLVSFPLVQNIHTNGILDTTIVGGSQW